MRTISNVLRLKHEAGLSYRQIARTLNLSLGTVANYLSAADAAGIGWPLPEGMDEAGLERVLSLGAGSAAMREPAFAAVDFAYVHQELKLKAVTRQLLWEEYRESVAAGINCYSYTQFCVLYRNWARRLSLSMRQTHRAGEKMFVDYCGPTVPVMVGPGDQTKPAYIFVAVLGASNYTYAEATWTQGSHDWIGSHVAAFTYFGGVPQLVVPDNLKSGVDKACRYEPLLNASFSDMLTHFGASALPARPKKPKDKAKVEVGVQIVQRWIMARLRHRTFLGLAELNHAVQELLVRLNTHPFKKLDGCRLSRYQELDRPALKALPQAHYEYAEWKQVRVHLDYHVEVYAHRYSVPHELARRQLDARITAHTVEVFHQGQRVASHPRSLVRGACTTTSEHMPRSHQAHSEWTPARFLFWANGIGPNTHRLVDHLLASKPHPEQGYRSCLGLLSLSKSYGPSRLEAACARALALGSPTRRSVEGMLKSGADRLEPVAEADQLALPAMHDNVRGAQYYR